MKVLIAASQEPFAASDVFLQAQELADALRRSGHQAELLTVPFQPRPAERVPSQMLACRLLESVSPNESGDLLIGLNFPAYLLPHPRKVLWIGSLSSGAYELWNHPQGSLSDSPRGAQVREMILQADRNLLTEAQAAFTVSAAVAARLATQFEVTLPPLYHPPPAAGQLRGEKAGNYLFIPGRFSDRNRQRLVIEALALTREPVAVRFAGATSDPKLERELKALVAATRLESRVQWLGAISRDEMREQYAQSLAVVSPPLQADYGYVTLEAMFSSKPVVTCTDSGGPIDFVQPGETGLVAEPTAPSLAHALDEIWADRQRARRWGAAGRAYLSYFDLSWENVVRQLCG